MYICKYSIHMCVTVCVCVYVHTYVKIIAYQILLGGV